MSFLEWDTTEAIVVWYEEGMEEGLEEVARNALAGGFSIEAIQKITGIDIEVIENMQNGG